MSLVPYASLSLNMTTEVVVALAVQNFCSKYTYILYNMLLHHQGEEINIRDKFQNDYGKYSTEMHVHSKQIQYKWLMCAKSWSSKMEASLIIAGYPSILKGQVLAINYIWHDLWQLESILLYGLYSIGAFTDYMYLSLKTRSPLLVFCVVGVWIFLDFPTNTDLHHQ